MNYQEWEKLPNEEKEVYVLEAKKRDVVRMREMKTLEDDQAKIGQRIIVELTEPHDIPDCIGFMPERPGIQQAYGQSYNITEMNSYRFERSKEEADEQLGKYKDKQAQEQTIFRNRFSDFLKCLNCQYFDKCAVLSGKYNTYTGE
jgi:hypothetical protein